MERVLQEPCFPLAWPHWAATLRFLTLCRRTRSHRAVVPMRLPIPPSVCCSALRFGLSCNPTWFLFTRLRLEDQAVSPLVWFDLDDLAPVNQGSGAIGWILDHKPLMQLLMERLHSHSRISLELGETVTPDHPSSAQRFDLQIACDGPRSPHRQAWGFPFWSMPYRQGLPDDESAVARCGPGDGL